jgi:hypothetical protein
LFVDILGVQHYREAMHTQVQCVAGTGTQVLDTTFSGFAVA